MPESVNRRGPGGDHMPGGTMHRGQDQIIDELLVLQGQDGRSGAMDALLTRWQERIHARALWLTGEHDGAAEVVQRSMIAIAGGIGSLDDPGAFGGWAMRIVAHKASDWIRQRKRRRKREESIGAAAHTADERADAGVGAVANVQEDATGDLARHVDRALDRLAPDRRAILVLHYRHGVPIDGLARVLGVPAGTVKSRLFHARRDLGRILERDGR